MEWTVVDRYTSIEIVDDIVPNLKEWLISSKVKCKVNLKLCEPNWLDPGSSDWLDPWLVTTGPTRAESSDGALGPKGPRGWEGPSKNPPDPKRIAEPKEVVVSIRFNVPSIHVEKLKSYKLHLTPNPCGKTLPAWENWEVTNFLPYCCGVYKRPGFDEAFKATKVLKPNLTEVLFATNRDRDGAEWEEDFVSVEFFHGWTNCIKTCKEFERVSTGESTVTLSLLAIDIEPNFEYITTVLSGL